MPKNRETFSNIESKLDFIAYLFWLELRKKNKRYTPKWRFQTHQFVSRSFHFIPLRNPRIVGWQGEDAAALDEAQRALHEATKLDVQIGEVLWIPDGVTVDG